MRVCSDLLHAFSLYKRFIIKAEKKFEGKLSRKNAAVKSNKDFCGQKQKVLIKIKYPEQVAEPESLVTGIFLFRAAWALKNVITDSPRTSQQECRGILE